jgi:50S ribosomal protein L16 3-hydroxylase
MPSSSPSFDRRLLGGLAPATFLARHWQRKPLLIRGALTSRPPLPDRSGLAALAARDDVESRLVSVVDGRWSMTTGPIARLPRAKRDWTLLVQGVNLHDRAADALMRRFDFVSTMRLDDLMISHAVDGGGVGPHLDSYDVFLLQVDGRRRWRWRDRRSIDARERTLVDDVPLKLLKHFEPTDEAVLEPGDMLYLPPSCAHEGVALGPCTTASIGFRAPSWNTLTQEFLFAMAEREWSEGLYADAGRGATRTPAALDPQLLRELGQKLARVRFAARDIEDFVGRYFSEPKADVFFDPPEPLTAARFVRRAKAGLAFDPRATMLYRGGAGFIAGEPFALPAGHRPTFRRLADRRRLAGSDLAIVLADPAASALLYDWWQCGWLVFDEESHTHGASRSPR